MALHALRRNIMRSLLTCVGIIIGIAAVIAMMEIGQAAAQAIEQTISSMGANTIGIEPQATSAAGVNCCGQDINRTNSLTLTFPFDAHKHTYPWWDDTTNKPFPMLYVGESEIQGLHVYHYHQHIDPVQINTIQLPGKVLENGSPDRLVEYVVRGATPGAIVLLHNGRKTTIEALPRIIAGLRKKGLGFVTIDQLNAYKALARQHTPDPLRPGG